MARLVTVANFRTRLDAEVAGGLLAAAGIPFLIQSGEGMGIVPAPAGADLKVNPEDAERAHAILADAGQTGW